MLHADRCFSLKEPTTGCYLHIITTISLMQKETERTRTPDCFWSVWCFWVQVVYLPYISFWPFFHFLWSYHASFVFFFYLWKRKFTNASQSGSGTEAPWPLRSLSLCPVGPFSNPFMTTLYLKSTISSPHNNRPISLVSPLLRFCVNM